MGRLFLMRHAATSARWGLIGVLIATTWGRSLADEGRRDLSGDPGILLLRNGGIVEGRILKAGDNYTVQRPNGDMFVPGVMVRLQCATINDAYTKLHETAAKDDSGETRVALARWCITNKLLKEARRELTDAMECEPSRGEAREILQKLDLTLDPPANAGKSAVDLTKSAPVTPRYTPDEIESLGGLSRDQGQHFMRRIQPMLVNNCAVGGCHGATSETGFKLQRVTPGGDTSRLAAERNLAEILEQIDYKTPRQSPILTIPDASHGRRGKPAFAGPRGADQLAELRKWVIEVAKSEAGRNRRDSIAQREKSDEGSVHRASEESDRKTDSGRGRVQQVQAQERSGKSEREGGRDPFGIRKAASGEPQRDPFDATEFNQAASRRQN